MATKARVIFCWFCFSVFSVLCPFHLLPAATPANVDPNAALPSVHARQQIPTARDLR